MSYTNINQRQGDSICLDVQGLADAAQQLVSSGLGITCRHEDRGYDSYSANSQQAVLLNNCPLTSMVPWQPTEHGGLGKHFWKHLFAMQDTTRCEQNQHPTTALPGNSQQTRAQSHQTGAQSHCTRPQQHSPKSIQVLGL
jgi:hypothetical protein